MGRIVIGGCGEVGIGRIKEEVGGCILSWGLVSKKVCVWKYLGNGR